MHVETLSSLLERSVATCRECAALIGDGEKPCVTFRVYSKWMPARVHVGFISSGPSWRSFFYDDRYYCRDRHILFDVLNVTSLKDFRASGFFYTTVVKCRTPKTFGRHFTELLGATLCRRDKLLEKLCRVCARRFLRDELQLLVSRGLQKLVIIGSTALQGVRYLKLGIHVRNVRCPLQDRITRIEIDGKSIDVLIMPDVWRFARQKMLKNLLFRFVYYPPGSKLV